MNLKPMVRSRKIPVVGLGSDRLLIESFEVAQSSPAEVLTETSHIANHSEENSPGKSIAQLGSNSFLFQQQIARSFDP
jgi:hypothetical protein